GALGGARGQAAVCHGSGVRGRVGGWARWVRPGGTRRCATGAGSAGASARGRRAGTESRAWWTSRLAPFGLLATLRCLLQHSRGDLELQRSVGARKYAIGRSISAAGARSRGRAPLRTRASAELASRSALRGPRRDRPGKSL